MTKQTQIAVIGGDGTGPEVAAEALKVLEAVAQKFDLRNVLPLYEAIYEKAYKANYKNSY